MGACNTCNTKDQEQEVQTGARINDLASSATAGRRVNQTAGHQFGDNQQASMTTNLKALHQL